MGIRPKTSPLSTLAMQGNAAVVPTVVPQSQFRAGALFWTGAWFGLLAGAGEVALQAIRKLVLHRIIGLSSDLVWMAPLADLFFFGILNLLLAPVVWRWPGSKAFRLAVFLFSFLAFFCMLLYTPIHMAAMLVLAAGLAMAASNVLSQRAAGFQTLTRRTLPFLVMAVLVMAVGMRAWQGNAERQELAALPAAAPGSPNVLLIVLDTVRAENLSLYGYDRPTTPYLESLAREGALFEQPISTAPWTLPSHASIFTGRWPHELSVNWDAALDGKYPTIAETLRDRGYLTAGFSANSFYVSREHGLNRGFIHFEDFKVSPGQIFVSSVLGQTLGCWHQLGPGCKLRPLTGYYEIPGRKSAADVNSEFLTWLSKQDGRPFFAFLNYFDAHAPYLPPQSFAEQFGVKRERGAPLFVENPLGAWTGTPEQTQNEINAYDGAIAYLDSQIHALMDELKQRGALENTIVIITSDHGEEFHEHGVMSHGNSLYLTSLHVPLLIVYPGKIPAGTVVTEPVTLRNIPATILNLAGMDGATPYPGAPLARYWDNQNDSNKDKPKELLAEVNTNKGRPDWYPVTKGDMKSLVADGMHYILNGDGSEELYDLNQDPREENNLANSEVGAGSLPWFRALLQNTIQANLAQSQGQP